MTTFPRHPAPHSSPHLDRRGFLRAGTALAAAGAVPVLRSAGAASQALPPRPRATRFPQRIELDLMAGAGTAQILPGTPTAVWKYTGSVAFGTGSELQSIPGSHVGPILRLARGQEAVIRLANQLGEDHTTHWHGLDVPNEMDGHPINGFPTGTQYAYSYPILNRAGTYWFHPHTHMRTAEQVYQGLAGLFIVSDEEEQSLPLPRGAQDVPLVLQDATFDATNQLVYTSNMMAGFLGSTILVNGRPGYVLSAATRIYRFRVLNGSLSRIYKLAWSDGTPLVVIGTDGGLIDAPRTYPYVMLSPGERVELWADFSQKPLGAQIVLQTLGFTGAGGAQGAALDLMRVSIDQVQAETLTLPSTLASYTPYQLSDAINAANPRSLPISFLMGTGFVLNGGLFGMTTVAPNEVVQRDTLEVIQISNVTGAMQVAHPIHFHGRQFQVLDRTITAGGTANWNTVKDGYLDRGWKDTFMIMPGETVRLLWRYSAYTGLFVYHCHNLVHEGAGMMRNLRIDL